MLCIKCRIIGQVLYLILKKYFPWWLPMSSTLLHERSDAFGRGEKIGAWPWRNLQTAGSCHILLKQQIEALQSRQLKPQYQSRHWGEFFSALMWGHSHVITHTDTYENTLHAHTPQTSSHIYRQTQTHIDSLPPPSTHKHPTAKQHSHTLRHTHAQSVWSVNLVPRGASRVTPLTGQTRLDSQQTDKY